MESDRQKGKTALRRKSGGPGQSEKGKRVKAGNVKPKKGKHFRHRHLSRLVQILRHLLCVLPAENALC